MLRGVLYFVAGLCFVMMFARSFTYDARRENAGRGRIDFDVVDRGDSQTILVLFVVSVGALAISARTLETGG